MSKLPTELRPEQSVKDLFDLLDSFSAGQMVLSSLNANGRVLACVVVARRANAQAIVDAIDAIPDEDEA